MLLEKAVSNGRSQTGNSFKSSIIFSYFRINSPTSVLAFAVAVLGKPDKKPMSPRRYGGSILLRTRFPPYCSVGFAWVFWLSQHCTEVTSNAGRTDITDTFNNRTMTRFCPSAWYFIEQTLPFSGYGSELASSIMQWFCRFGRLRWRRLRWWLCSRRDGRRCRRSSGRRQLSRSR